MYHERLFSDGCDIPPVVKILWVTNILATYKNLLSIGFVLKLQCRVLFLTLTEGIDKVSRNDEMFIDPLGDDPTGSAYLN